MTATSNPFFSIVTATYNAEQDLPALRRSLIAQSEPSWEWVVQDGASTDGTVGSVNSAGDPRIALESRPDHGIYEGLNRALDRVRGRYVLVLGADDELADPDVLSRLRAVVERAHAAPDVVLAAAEVGPGRIFRSSLGVKTLLINTVHHQGALYSASQFDDFRFDLSAKVVADYEHSLRLFLGRASAVTADVLVARCGADGVSHRVDERVLYAEMHRLRRKHLPAALSKVLQLVGTANVLRRRVLAARPTRAGALR